MARIESVKFDLWKTQNISFFSVSFTWFDVVGERSMDVLSFGEYMTKWLQKMPTYCVSYYVKTKMKSSSIEWIDS